MRVLGVAVGLSALACSGEPVGASVSRDAGQDARQDVAVETGSTGQPEAGADVSVPGAETGAPEAGKDATPDVSRSDAGADGVAGTEAGPDAAELADARPEAAPVEASVIDTGPPPPSCAADGVRKVCPGSLSYCENPTAEPLCQYPNAAACANGYTECGGVCRRSLIDCQVGSSSYGVCCMWNGLLGCEFTNGVCSPAKQ